MSPSDGGADPSSGAGCGNQGEGEEINVDYHHRQVAGEQPTVVVAFRLATEKSWSGGVSKRMQLASPLPAARRPPLLPCLLLLSLSFSFLLSFLHVFSPPAPSLSTVSMQLRLYGDRRPACAVTCKTPFEVRRPSSSPPMSPAACPTSWCTMDAIQIEQGHERRRAPLLERLLCCRRLTHRRLAEWSTSGTAIPAVTCASLRR
uniref:Uncharacterized protein n=1 Tax=Triticum urartu TaxID=4572 RepID=A0A8R7U470_TRIUA